MDASGSPEPFQGYEDMVVEKRADGVVVARLDVPDKLNALTPASKYGLLRLVREVDADDSAKVLVLTGTGRGFCSGADVSKPLPLGTVGPRTRKELKQPQYSLAIEMHRLDKPVIGAINGTAAGAGVSLALMCDLRIAATSAQFITAFVRRSVQPDAGITWLLPRVVGASRALSMLWLSDSISAEEALQIGLVDKVVPSEKLMDEALSLAARLAASPSVVIELTKRAVYRGLVRDLPAQAEYEEALAATIAKTADYQEGLQSFREKRRPVWQGK